MKTFKLEGLIKINQRDPKAICENCISYFKGECRKNPPHAFLGPPDSTMYSGFPAVAPDDFCTEGYKQAFVLVKKEEVDGCESSS